MVTIFGLPGLGLFVPVTGFGLISLGLLRWLGSRFRDKVPLLRLGEDTFLLIGTGVFVFGCLPPYTFCYYPSTFGSYFLGTGFF